MVEAIADHHAWLEETGELARRRSRRARQEVEAIALTRLRERWTGLHERTELDAQADRVASGETDPYAAADALLATYAEGTGA